MSEYKLVPFEPTDEMGIAGCEAVSEMPNNTWLDHDEAVACFKAMLAAAAPAVRGEPAAYMFADDMGRTKIVLGKETAEHWCPPGEKIDPLYAAPQPAEQQPDVALPAVAEQVTEVESPSNSLPSWSECNLRVGNSEWLKDNDIDAECDSLTANPLHEFIYEYDDSDAYKSAWFLYRLENLIGFIRSEQPDVTPTAHGPLFLSDEKILEIASNPMVSPCSPWWLKNDVKSGDVQNSAIAFARAVLKAATPEVGWQPIETAPKEGAFLVTGGKMYDDLCFVDDSYDVALVNAAERGTRYEVRDTCYYSMWVVGATHWMPLPLPPKE